MNYVRTVAGGMIAIKLKINTLIAEIKQTAVVKSSRNSKKGFCTQTNTAP